MTVGEINLRARLDAEFVGRSHFATPGRAGGAVSHLRTALLKAHAAVLRNVIYRKGQRSPLQLCEGNARKQRHADIRGLCKIGLPVLRIFRPCIQAAERYDAVRIQKGKKKHRHIRIHDRQRPALHFPQRRSFCFQIIILRTICYITNSQRTFR